MSVKIYMWLPRADISGHASLELENGTYISYRSEERNLKWPDFNGDSKIQSQGPDLTFTARGLDLMGIEKWWTDLKSSGWNHWFTRYNCYSTVVSALRAGGADDKLTTRQRWYYKSIVFWNAEKLSYYATDLEACT